MSKRRRTRNTPRRRGQEYSEEDVQPENVQPSVSSDMGDPTDGVPMPAMWIPAFRGFGGERYCLPELRTGGGQGMVASVWSVQQLLHPSNVWARLKREAGSDEEFTAGVHYEVTDFEPTHVLFSRVGHTPVVGIREDTASGL